MLNSVPLATVYSLAAIATAVFLVVTNQIPLDNPDDFLKFFVGLGAFVYGSGKLGEARNGAGHGTN